MRVRVRVSGRGGGGVGRGGGRWFLSEVGGLVLTYFFLKVILGVCDHDVTIPRYPPLYF